MTITATQSNAAENTRVATIGHKDDAAVPAAAAYAVGFTPRHVVVENQTDAIRFEWFEGMTSGHAIKTIATGARTAETSGGVTVGKNTVGFPVLQNKQYRVKVTG